MSESELPTPEKAVPEPAAALGPVPTVAPPPPTSAPLPEPRIGLGKVWLAFVALAAFVIAMAWWFDGRLYATQAELARRQQSADTASIEARTIARQSADSARELAARVAVLESREQDLALQRQALQQMYQDFAKSRDDAFLGQTAELIALAQQQAELTGSLSPLVGTLEMSAHRLEHSASPRGGLVLHAVQADIARLRASVAPDVPAAAQRLDELAAMIDKLQLLSSASPLEGASAPAASSVPPKGASWKALVAYWAHAAWAQISQLVTVTRIDRADALLMAPRQSVYLRENLKLRVLNARLDLLSRNASAYRADMRAIGAMLHDDFNGHQAAVRLAQTLSAQAAQIDLAARPAANLHSLEVLASFGLGGG